MKKIAITGNIASGKSQVEKIVSTLGYKVIDTDEINNSILLNDIPTIEEIKTTFKNFDISDEQGNISKPKLGEIVFSNADKKIELENILHKKIFEKIDTFYKENSNENAVFVAIPLLFETKKENDFDKIIFISADKEIRLKRLMQRNNYTREYALTRINSQMDETEKIKKSDFVIYNNSDLISLEKHITTTLNKLFSC